MQIVRVIVDLKEKRFTIQFDTAKIMLPIRIVVGSKVIKALHRVENILFSRMNRNSTSDNDVMSSPFHIEVFSKVVVLFGDVASGYGSLGRIVRLLFFVSHNQLVRNKGSKRPTMNNVGILDDRNAIRWRFGLASVFLSIAYFIE